MNFKKRDIVNRILLILTIIIVSLIIFMTNSIINHIFSLICFVIVLALINRFDFMHPSIWFGFFLLLYSIAHPVLYYLGDLKAMANGYNSLGIKISWIALAMFSLSVGLTDGKKYTLNSQKNQRKLLYLIDSANILYFISSLSMIFIMLYIYTSGIQTKTDIFLTSSIHSLVALVSTVFVLSSLIIYSYNRIVLNKRDIKKLIFLFIISSLFYLFTGERDVLFKLILSVTLINFSLGYLKKKHFIVVSTSALLLIPIILNFGIRGGTYNPDLNITSNSSLVSFISTFLGSEFSSASLNTQVIVQSFNSSDYMFFKPFLSAFLEFPMLPNLTGFRSIQWYYETYYPTRQAGSGVGFTLVGEGYISYGIVGVMIWFMLIGLILKFFYKHSKNDILVFLIYILIIPIVIYSNRASLLVIISEITRTSFALFGLILVGQILRSRSMSKRKEKINDLVNTE